MHSCGNETKLSAELYHLPMVDFGLTNIKSINVWFRDIN